ncbi:MAG: hypothetical protein AAF198_09390 [Pseudomonadota bacterium]
MIKTDAPLPWAATTEGPLAALFELTQDIGGHWFSADKTMLDLEDGAVGAIRGLTNDAKLTPVEPNEGNLKPGSGGVVFTEGLHCGLWLEGGIDRAERFSIAVVYDSPDDAAKTLLTVNDQRGRNYAFISEGEGMLRAKDDENQFEIDVPIQAGPNKRAVILSRTAGSVGLHVFGQKPKVVLGRVPGLRGPADLFVGCRSHRGGLLKTLGASVVHEVFAFPGLALHEGATDIERKASFALDRYIQWSA